MAAGECAREDRDRLLETVRTSVIGEDQVMASWDCAYRTGRACASLGELSASRGSPGYSEWGSLAGS